MKWSIEQIESPLGALVCVTREGALVALEFPENHERLHRYLARRSKEPRSAPHEEGASRTVTASGAVTTEPDASGASGAIAARIRAYFAGELDALDDIAVEVAGTDFERRVYAELRRVKRGTVVAYSELARRAGRPDAVRAVGATNAKNPISIVVPCHRVIGMDGSLTGYAGGLERKRWLLTHEGATVPARTRAA